jgi:hypothetical protein
MAKRLRVITTKIREETMSKLAFKATVVLCLSIFVLVFASQINAQVVFSDDFNRADGPVGNGWTTWWDSQLGNTSEIYISNGELITHGYPNQAGGVSRPLPITFPVSFSFDFHSPLTAADNQCNRTGIPEAGWLIYFNVESPAIPNPFLYARQVGIEQYAGTRNIIRSYFTGSGLVSDPAPGLPEPIVGWQDFSNSPAHITGVINADLSATVTVQYADMSTVTVSFGPAVGAVVVPPGSQLVFGNSSCNTGPQIFDNLSIARPLPERTGSISSNFNGTAIGGRDVTWFNSVLNVQGLGASPVNVFLTNSTIQFVAGSTPYTLSVPNATITFSPTATSATTTFDVGTNTWLTTVPFKGLAGNSFLDALALLVPGGGLPGGIKNVTWQGSFASDTPGISVNWQWSAAVYTSFGADYNAEGVKPVDDNKASAYKNSDHAGTPENYKSFVIGGAMGGGGSNFTGGYSGTQTIRF